MNHRLVAMCATILSGIALLSGCGPRTDPQAAPVPLNRRDYALPQNQVVLLEPDLQKFVTVEANNAYRTAGGSLGIAVTLRNRADDPMRLSARTRFQGPDGRPLEESSWTELFVERRGLVDYKVSSLNGDAATYIIEVQLAR